MSQEAIATTETDATSSNNLKECGVEEDGPDLCSSENQNSTSSNDATTHMSTHQNLNRGEPVFPLVADSTRLGDIELLPDFGSPTLSISSGNADGNGYGNFEYSVPSGYYSLNSKNLAEFG